MIEKIQKENKISQEEMRIVLDDYLQKCDKLLIELKNKEQFKGERGIQGEKGIQGESGMKGEQGIQGIRGEKGIQGEKGERGLRGEQGVKGEKGEKGDKGADGLVEYKKLELDYDDVANLVQELEGLKLVDRLDALKLKNIQKAVRKYALNVIQTVAGGTNIHSELENLLWSVAGHTIDTDMDMNNNSITEIETIQFIDTYTPTGTEPTGTMYYDSTKSRFDLILPNGQLIPISEQDVVSIKNQSGHTLLKGRHVMLTGSPGNSGIVLADYSITDGSVSSGYILGVVAYDIPNGQEGKCISRGFLSGLQTNGANYGEVWVDGDILYPVANGGWSKYEPSAPNWKMGEVAVINAHPSNGILAIRITIGFDIDELNDVQITNVQPSDILVHDTNKWYNEQFNEMGTPAHSAGWLDRTITPTITVTGGNLTYTLTGTATYYVSGTKYDVTNFTSGSRAMTKGNKYFFYQDTTNTQQWSTSAWDITSLSATTLLTYYYDDTHYIPFEERHSSRRNPHAHRELHFKIGTYWSSGFAIANYTLDSSTASNWRWSLSSGIIYDEDLAHTLSAWASGSYNNMYRELTTGYWYWDIGATNPIKVGANGRVNYNNPTGWTQTEVNVGQLVNYYIVAFPSLNGSTQVFNIQGQTFYTTEANAVASTISQDITWGTVPAEELSILYKVTIQASGSGDKNFIANVLDLRGSTTSTIVGSSTTVSNHNSLSGLQGGTAGEYYHLTSVTETAKTSGDTLINNGSTWQNLPLVDSDTETNILNATDNIKIGVTNDSYFLMVKTGTQWYKVPVKVYAEDTTPDMGAGAPMTENARTGYGTDYITGKLLNWIQIGTNADAVAGAIRNYLGATLQVYNSSTWSDIVVGFRFRERATGLFVLEHKPIGTDEWFEVLSGNSTSLGQNGIPQYQQYTPTAIGANPVELVVGGGTWT